MLQAQTHALLACMLMIPLDVKLESCMHWLGSIFVAACLGTEVVPAWSTHVGNNTVLEDDVIFLHKQEELAVGRGLGQKPVAQVCCCIAPL